MSELTRAQWESVLEDTSPATFGELVATLQERDLVDDDPAELVEAGITDEGPLIEDEDAPGAFAVYQLGTPTDEIASTPDPEPEQSGEDDPGAIDDVVVDLDSAPPIERAVFPVDLLEVEQWLAWKPTDDGRKVPRAPYENPGWPDKFVSAQDPDVWRDFDTVTDWCEKLSGYEPAFNIRNRDEYPDEEFVLIDYDDARDPETEEIHPVVREHIKRAGSYTDVSTSGTGVHIFCRGELPEGVKAIEAELPEDDRFPGAEIEVYDSARFSAMTGDHVAGTPDRTTDCQAFLEELADDFATVAEGTPDELLEEPEKTREEIADVETTTDVQDVLDAIQHTGPRDIRLRSTVTHERADGTKSLDPSWASSKSGTRLAQVDGGWVYRKGMHGLDALQVVALEERIISRVDEYPSGEDFWDAVDALRSRGAHIPEYVRTEDVDAESDPEHLKALDVTLDPGVAWRAAGAVTPDELDGDLELETNADGTAWCCPHCGSDLDVVRATALDTGIAAGCCPDLGDEAYHNAYQYARRSLEAPLPEYVNHHMATERWDLIRGALRQLDFWHLDEDAFESEITGRGDAVDGEAQLTIDPAWRHSDSGASVLVFQSGTVYEAHPDHEGVLDVLRFVGLDAGVIDWEEFTSDEYQLAGETFREVYATAREYGAPLPRWEGTDAYHTAVLPPAEDLVDEDVGDDDRLAAAYDAVADLYTEAAETEEASLLRVLPGLGKTEQVFRNATGYPVLYTAGRKELMADGVARAEANGASAYILPVFAENGPPTVVSTAAEAAVREHGQRLLRDRWSLVECVKDHLPDGEELRKPEEYDGADEDEVHLDRESCPTANGDYGLDWWLAVHAARARGYRPQQIHENAPALFGADLPCTCGEDDEEEATCPYTEAWEVATDPEAPTDVLIGHYTHAHVEGARTYAVREQGRVKKTPRVVAVDEFPGEAFQREFGEEFPDLAAWLAAALREDVDDRQDLLTKAADLWSDETVREWLAVDDTSDEHGRVATALGSADAGLEALSTAEWLLEERRETCEDLDVANALERLVDAHPEFDAGTITAVTAELSAAVQDDDNRGAHTSTLNQVEDVADSLREVQLAESTLDADLADALAGTTHVDGALASLVDEAIEGFRERDESARNRLDAAITALQGGPDGCEALAMHADDGYAHPLAHALLYGLLAPSDADDVATVRTSNFTFGREEGTRLSSVAYRKSRVIVDRNHHGAVVNHPPAFTAGTGKNPVVGLDATGRPALWELTLGRDVTLRDIHDSDRERREFLREVYGLQLVQTSPHANSYEGDPTGKNFDDDVELVRQAGEQYADVVGQKPAVLTTKVVEETLEDRLEGIASATGHYGDLKGSNALSDHRLAVLLGCQHYGDHVVERWAALAGEEATRTGHGMALDYNSRIANTALNHMREDQVMQAALRFGRDSDGALVFTHTAALRDDLPVVADGEVVRTFSKQAQAIATAASELSRLPRFTAGDVADRVDGFDPSRRTVRRVLSDLAEFGYLEKTETPNGYANEFAVSEEPRAAEVELPDLDTRTGDDHPGQDALEVYYTWSVRVAPGDPRPASHRPVGSAQLPAPGGGDDRGEASAPPG